PFDTKLSLLGDDLFQDLLSGCMNSIWAKNRVSPKGIRTRKTRSQINNGYIGQNMKDRSEGEYVAEDFASNFLHEMRNSSHGYHLHGGAFEEFLVMHYGQVPDSLPDLALIWYFLLLADLPGLISGNWTRGVHPRSAATKTP